MTTSTVLGAALDREARRALVEGRADLDGIDFVEVLANYPGTPDAVPAAPQQQTLLVHLLNRPVPPDWDGDRVAISGGVRADPRVNPVLVRWAYPVLAIAPPDGTRPKPLPRGVDDADWELIHLALPKGVPARERVLAVRTSTSGDWSTYTLRLVGDGGRGVPDGFDPPLAQAGFSFTVDCPSDLDCEAPEAAVAAPGGSPLQDYLARDYDALRTRLHDRLSALMPTWGDRSPADPAVMLVELFAYLGDRLAYWQDAVAVEAYLGTARRRASVRRHARLLDYAVHDGCSSRVWLAVTTDVATTLRAGAAVSDSPPAAADVLPVQAHEARATVVETCADLAVRPARNQLELYAWGDPDHLLAAGTTSAFVAYPTAAGDPELGAGQVLVLADLPPAGAGAGGVEPVRVGDPTARFAVRLDRKPVVYTDALRPDLTVLEVHWDAGDALPTPLRVSEPASGGGGQVRAVALANVVLADHGATVTWEPLVPPQPPAVGPYRPRLARSGLASAPPAVPPAGGTVTSTVPTGATSLQRPDPRAALPQVSLDDGERLWSPRPDLIASSRLDLHFVVETEARGIARLRFGDGVTGRAPGLQATYTARYRLGGGSAGNVGSGRLTYWLRRADGGPAVDAGADLRVWNPLPASGGADPEPLEQVRQLAPSAYRTQLRAVTSADYAAVAETVPGVQQSVARRRWAGSWYVQEVTVDPETERADDPTLPRAVTGLLELRRMAGVDVEVAPPVSVPLHIRLFGCLEPGYVAGDVEAQLLDVLSSRTLPDGGQGFFHPDRFTFGQPLYVSDLVAAAMGVPGLAWVDVRTFARLGDPVSATVAALAQGRIDVQPHEVVRCDSDPNNPEAGRVEVELGGGA